MNSWKRLAAVGVIAAAVPAAMLLVGVMACGPDFEPEVFVTPHHPDQPAKFAEGHLGILQNGYYHAELVVAYRYLSGGKLSDTEKAAYLPAMQASDNPYAWDQQRTQAATLAMNAWQSARTAAAPDVKSEVVSELRMVDQKTGDYVIHGEELNCTDGAFLTAAKTLQARAATWGAASPELKEWLRGQDAVFANCTSPSPMPDPAQPSWDALLRQDRAYQIAAANFYAGNFDDAISGFLAIGKDKGSTWNRWGEYLAARAEIRKAARTGKSADFGQAAMFDNAGLQSAQTRLLNIKTETHDAEIRHAAQIELNFIQVRLDPSKRLDAAAVALVGPNPDPDFAQDLADLDCLMDAKKAGDSDLVTWMGDMQGLPLKSGTIDAQSVSKRSKDRQSLPWIVAALSRTPLKTGYDNDLLNSAASVKPSSPGYQTVSYYRAGQMIGAGNNAEARTLLTTMLTGLGPDAAMSTRNLFLSQRMQTARNLDEFLADAPRTLINAESSAAEMAQCANGQSGTGSGCTGKIPPQEFDADAATDMNTQMPLSLLEQAAENTTLPAHLRQAVAEAAWVRALGLDDAASVSRMSRLLPEPVRRAVGESDGFPATLALLRAPGLRPYLDQGVQRSASFANMDHYGDNWWCGQWTDGSAQGAPQGPQPAPAATLPFLSAQQRQKATEEAARLNSLPAGLVWTAQRAIAYVKAHPSDKDAPETLALIVQGTHWGCGHDYGPQTNITPQRAMSKEAFEMLHRMYPKSEWAIKTKYYY